MWNDRLRLAESVQEDWSALTAENRATVLDALKIIDDNPIAGAPLFDPLKGLWAYRAEHVRIVYRIVAEARVVMILSITRATALS